MRIVEENATLISLSRGYGPLEKLSAADVIEYAGRLCYKSEPKGDPKSFIDMLKSKRPTPHLAVMEFGWCAFHVVTDRGISHEAVRQRIASYAQESTRWINYAKEKFGREIAVICPPELRPCEEGQKRLNESYKEFCHHRYLDACRTCEIHQAWRTSCEQAESSYLTLIDYGSPPQFARSVLPTCTKTEFAWAANFREWWQVVLPTRAHPTAHPQMVRIMRNHIFPQLAVACPEVFGDWQDVLRGIGVTL